MSPAGSCFSRLRAQGFTAYHARLQANSLRMHTRTLLRAEGLRASLSKRIPRKQADSFRAGDNKKSDKEAVTGTSHRLKTRLCSPCAQACSKVSGTANSHAETKTPTKSSQGRVLLALFGLSLCFGVWLLLFLFPCNKTLVK